jgi:hypothetical protein
MLALIEKEIPINTPKPTQNDTCIIDDATVICGKINEVDYLYRVESKMIIEQFYGDIDLFGF